MRIRLSLWLGLVLGSRFCISSLHPVLPESLPKPAERILALPAGEIYWYPATVLRVEAHSIEVLFDLGGTRTKLKRDFVRPLKLNIGSSVFGQWNGGKFYHPGTITAIDKASEKVRIQYEDGQKEMTTLSRVKVPSQGITNYCQVGEAVYAMDPKGQFWVPSLIVEKTPLSIRLKSFNFEMRAPLDKVRALSTDIGERVFGFWKQGFIGFPGRIGKRDKQRIFVQYDDGDEEWTTIPFVQPMIQESDYKTVQRYCLRPDKRHLEKGLPDLRRSQPERNDVRSIRGSV